MGHVFLATTGSIVSRFTVGKKVQQKVVLRPF